MSSRPRTFVTAALALAAVLSIGAFAAGSPIALVVSHDPVAAGERVGFTVTGAAAGSAVVTFVSLNPTPTTVGPIETGCRGA